ncbi:cytochrome P450 [Streptomyces sp. JJ36]|uniref:cytochrome P450 n=1 Tax=Streptomyces sp. JJ36 TaxID=2736645 RepID=UPI001F361274|nr:cytochrome P450 [Streptomyces sp. JJ36]MCF6522295.1 cytochrome P450 [Streptomyces sp. JJ36]
MTPHPPDGAQDAPATPPPGCPAHASGTDGLTRLHGPEAVAGGRDVYERLRAQHGPVAPVLIPGELPAWLVLGYREILEVVRTPSLFTRDGVWTHADQLGPGHPLTPILAPQPLCVFSDGMQHQRWRGAVTWSLSQFAARGVRRHVARFADQLVDGFAADGHADLVAQWAEQLPMLVMTKLLGLPEEEGPQLVAKCRDLMKGTETAAESNDYLTRALQQLVETKRRTPGHDIVSKLIEHASELDDDEVREHARLLLIAANATTIGLITNTLHLVLTDPRFRGNLSGGQMTLPDALEQVLWDRPPLAVCPFRIAGGDTELGGQRIAEGDLLLLGLAAGNVDPDIRPDLDSPMHGNRSHLAFSGGPHECPGQDLGRTIADTGIDTLLQRLPDLRLAVDVAEVPSDDTWMEGRPGLLPAQFTPRPPGNRTGTPVAATAAQPLPETVPSTALPEAESVPPGPAVTGLLKRLRRPARH